MRAIFLENDFSENIVVVDGDRAKHLIKVIRIREDEEVFLLNGKGIKARSRVKEIDKKSLSLEILSKEECNRVKIPDVFIGTPKKDYFESICRTITELGVNNLYHCKTEYSQAGFKEAKANRFEKIVESALIQSNNPFMPEIVDLVELKGLDELVKNYENVVYFTSQGETKGKVAECDLESSLVIFGPEGGLSPAEEKYINDLPNSISIHLPLPIMKAVTAVPVGLGFLLGVSSSAKG